MRRFVLVSAMAMAGAAVFAGAAEPEVGAQAPIRDRALYGRLCAPCHGERGDGLGPAAPLLWPQPRDFTKGALKWGGSLDRIARVIDKGVAGTSMPAFGDVLARADIEKLANRVLAFSRPSSAAPGPSARPRDIAASSNFAARGRAAYARLRCAECHGPAGRSDGPAAATLKDDRGIPDPPYDLVANPPRGGRTGADVYRALLDGVPGTPMPAYGPSATPSELRDLAEYVARLSAGVTTPATRARPTDTDPRAVALWAAAGARPPSSGIGFPVPPQGPAPAAFAPALTSLEPSSCGRCHAKQLREWRDSVHASAMGPGLAGQTPGMQPAAIRDCQRCHAPLDEQLRTRVGSAGKKDVPNPAFHPGLAESAINCAACHVRSFIRHGPPRAAGSKLLASAAYPFSESEQYERADFCLPCHQHLPDDNIVNGKPLLNTYREWLEGPYFRQGIVCQHCHMPDREHSWKGIHDPETVRQGLRFDFDHKVTASRLSASVTVTNVACGHQFPTTPTPAAFLRLWIEDEVGKRVAGSLREQRIGRKLHYGDSGWEEVEDTRLAPGSSRSLTWQGPLPREARTIRAQIEIRPDAYYEGFYAEMLAERDRSAESRKLLGAALDRARTTPYLAFDRSVALR